MIYLDNAATTPLDEDILEVMLPYLKEEYGNASSQHSVGRSAANAVIKARDTIAKIMGVNAGDVYFTCGGTEADNAAIKGVCLANMQKGKHIVLSAIEHPALIESAKDLADLGFETTFVAPDGDGVVSAEAIKKAIRRDTVFVSVMAANNETGVIQPIKDIYSVCKDAGVFFYCDCVQTAGALDFANFPADGIGISAHKFYGPKGVGALYINSKAKWKRFMSGGHQERGMRGGTTNTAAIVGFALALKKATEQRDYLNKQIAEVRDTFLDRVLATVDGVHLNGKRDNRLPSNANLSFDGCDGQNVVMLLDMAGIATSTGSACSAGAVTPSHVITAMGLGVERANSAVRFTFGKHNTVEEAMLSAAEVKRVVEQIRRK
jgi:cysteine desulfurase